MYIGTHTTLPGLPGTNPLGFLAAIGAQVSLHAAGQAHGLHWDVSLTPRAVLTPAVQVSDIADSAIKLSTQLLKGPALSHRLDATLKLKGTEIRQYLADARREGGIESLAWCLLAEDALYTNGKAKPTEFYFMAGQMKFVTIARKILGEAHQHCELVKLLIDDMSMPWTYKSECPTLRWDTVDDRHHALSAFDPTSDQNRKLTNPGAELLALLGLTRYPYFASSGRILTTGCSVHKKSCQFIWPIWNKPASLHAVTTLLAQVTSPDERAQHRKIWYSGWAISEVLSSQIRRSSQGGYGTFGPPKSVWSA